ncbi:lipase family protein [Microcoleus sp. FACHB-831]|uniref:lipase family protein n=1 Tax=Microcoleus sp. FACHB-831 TaxID=2692827 RepID=UPI001689B4DB|nr:lipase family protein [Microcoleus sp. FACHB-831]MBD1919768.1 lipase family protein [Microcoleus sp. FACHB-831]
MSKIKVSQNSRFELERAVELLDLVEEAHKRYAQAKAEPEWNWDTDYRRPIILNGKRYNVLKYLGFAQYFLAIRRRVPFGFIAQQENNIFVVFRGTMNSAEWISNFKACQEPFLDLSLPLNRQIALDDDDDPFLEDTDSIMKEHDKFNLGILAQDIGEVHRGFYRTYTRLDRGGLLDGTPANDRPSMKESVETTLNNLAQDSQIFVTGHSLGGALATIAALHISKMNSFNPPILYTFASPRVGDQRFAQQFENLECYRIANSEDLVPTIPLATKLLTLRASLAGITGLWKNHLSKMDYQHIGEPLYFTTQKGSVSDNHTIPVYQEALNG